MTGPYETEQQAADDIRDAYSTDLSAYNLGYLSTVLTEHVGELGEHDQRILEWLAGWEPTTVVVVADWIKRAAREK